MESGTKVKYRKISVEALADEQPASFDVVTCMEMLEHVPNPVSGSKPAPNSSNRGRCFSPPNRHPKAYLLAIVAAEHVLRMIPKGTHDYNAFIKPSELGRWSQEAGPDDFWAWKEVLSPADPAIDPRPRH